MTDELHSPSNRAAAWILSRIGKLRFKPRAQIMLVIFGGLGIFRFVDKGRPGALMVGILLIAVAVLPTIAAWWLHRNV